MVLVRQPRQGRPWAPALLLPALLLVLVTGACTTTPTAPSAGASTGTLVLGAASSGPDAAPSVVIPAPSQALGATRFIAFGDSITAGVLSEVFDGMFLADEAGSYPTLLRNAFIQYHQPQMFTVFNEGVPGETARVGADRLPGVLTTREPQVLMLLEGINDMATAGRSPEQTAANVHYMVETARLFNCTVLVATMPQTYYSFNPNTGRERFSAADKIVPFNTELRRLSQACRTSTSWILRGVRQRRSMMGPDGLHPHRPATPGWPRRSTTPSARCSRSAAACSSRGGRPEATRYTADPVTPPSDPAPDPTPSPRPSLRARLSRHPLLTAWLAFGVILLGGSVWALDYAARWQPDGRMTATVWQGADGAGGAPVRTSTTTRFDPERLAVEAGLSPREPFVVEWRGWLVAEEGGTHRLRVRMDDAVGLWVDEAPIIDGWRTAATRR